MFIDDVVIDILLIIFLYLIAYSIYFAFNVYTSTKKKQIGIEQKYYAQDLTGNLMVIVYKDNSNNDIISLVKSLKAQKYPKDNYQVHVIFDNCNDNGESDEVEKLGGVKVWRISNGNTMGKDAAVSWLLTRLISFRNVHAFVFLDANRSIDDNFLTSVNTALFTGDVIVGATEYNTPQNDVIALVKNAAKKYKNRIFQTSRTILKLITPINSGVTAIKQDVLETIKTVNFKDIKNEYEYSLSLSMNGFKPIFAPDVKSRIDYNEEPHLSFKDKMDILKYSFKNLYRTDFNVFEFLFSMFTPSALLIIILYGAIFAFLYNFEVKNYFFYDMKYVLCLAIITTLIYIKSLFVAAEEKINPILLFLSPLYNVVSFILRLEKKKPALPKIMQQPRGIEYPVDISDNENTLKCTIEIKTSEKGVQAALRYKTNTLESSVQITTQKAINEIAKKLRESDLTMKICSDCAHFGFKPNSGNNPQKGLCSQKDKMTGDVQPETMVMDSCEYFKPLSELNNVIELNKTETNEQKEKNDNNEENDNNS